MATGPSHKVLGDEVMVECPYNQVHIVRDKRMVRHLLKCRRNWEKDFMKMDEPKLMLTCKYNIYHVIPAPEILYHEKSCLDRGITTAYMIQFTEVDKNYPSKFVKSFNLYTTNGNPCRPSTKTPNEDDEGEELQQLELSKMKTIELNSNVVANTGVSFVFTNFNLNKYKLRNAKQDDFESTAATCSQVDSEINGMDKDSAVASSLKEETQEKKSSSFSFVADEDWEGESKGKVILGYNPMKRFSDKDALFKYPYNMSKGERKAWKVQNVEKVKALMETGWAYGNVIPAPFPEN